MSKKKRKKRLVSEDEQTRIYKKSRTNFEAITRMMLKKDGQILYGFQEMSRYLIDSDDHIKWCDSDEAQVVFNDLLNNENKDWATYLKNETPFPRIWIECFGKKSLDIKDEIKGIGLDLLGEKPIGYAAVFFGNNLSLAVFSPYASSKKDVLGDTFRGFLFDALLYINEHQHNQESSNLGISENRLTKHTGRDDWNTFVAIRPKRIAPLKSLNLSHDVDWKHRWTVRGHWRNIRGVGKDQEGTPVIGKTWVKDCIKGPEDKPLVNKTRVVVNGC